LKEAGLDTVRKVATHILVSLVILRLWASEGKAGGISPSELLAHCSLLNLFLILVFRNEWLCNKSRWP